MFHFNKIINLTKKSSNDHINRSNPLQIFCKISVLINFAKFTGKHLCQGIVLNKVVSRKNFQNSQESTCAVALSLIKLQTEKISKIC